MLRRLALSSAIVALVAGARPPAVPDSAARALQQRLDIWAQVEGHLGANASVILANGARWNGAAGFAGPDVAMRTDHLVQIASITKTMTAAVVLQLVDEGVMRLEDRIARWLSPLPNVDPSITIRQLLNHSNGLANYTDEPRLGEAIGRHPTHVFSAAELLQFVGPPAFKPGEATAYTNTSFLLLGLIVERVTGRAIVDVYRQRLWEPLDLTAMFLPGFGEPPGPLAQARRLEAIVNPLDQLSRLTIGHSAFGVLSNAAAVATWGRALFSGAVISEAMQREMRALAPAPGSIPGETGVGLGIRGYGYFERTQFGHSGGASFGSSLLLFDPDSGVTVAVVMNQATGANHFTEAPALLEIATRR